MKLVRNYIYFHFLKRLLDIIFSLLLIIVMSPIIILAGALVYLIMGLPVLERKEVTGQNEQPFTLLTFRTEGRNGAESSFGSGLRSSGLHELPIFFHILSGKMSFIGPRPLPFEDTLFMDEQQRERYFVKPGLTGWAQVNGGKGLSWEDALTYDVHYVHSVSFRMDISTLMMTLAAGVRQETASLEGQEEIKGLGEHLLENGSIDRETYDRKLEKIKQQTGR